MLHERVHALNRLDSPDQFPQAYYGTCQERTFKILNIPSHIIIVSETAVTVLKDITGIR